MADKTTVDEKLKSLNKLYEKGQQHGIKMERARKGEQFKKLEKAYKKECADNEILRKNYDAANEHIEIIETELAEALLKYDGTDEPRCPECDTVLEVSSGVTLYYVCPKCKVPR